MKPRRTATTDTVLGSPRDWDEAENGECEGLPIVTADGVMFSYWCPNVAEWFAIIFGRKIRLGVFGQSHPPVSLDTLS